MLYLDTVGALLQHRAGLPAVAARSLRHRGRSAEPDREPAGPASGDLPTVHGLPAFWLPYVNAKHTVFPIGPGGCVGMRAGCAACTGCAQSPAAIVTVPRPPSRAAPRSAPSSPRRAVLAAAGGQAAAAAVLMWGAAGGVSYRIAPGRRIVMLTVFTAERHNSTQTGYRHDPRSSLSPMMSKSIRRKICT
jgi:hypothetical protein